MFQEQYKDTVYFSDTLKADYPAVYQKITALLDKNHVCHSFLKGTEDYWCRDYMPVQCGYNQFIQFRYHPDYLEKVRDKETSTKTAITLSVKATGVSPESFHPHRRWWKFYGQCHSTRSTGYCNA
jgi:hypothetical protein